jgi:succinoglycan biosynthesis transport protein ExoP
MTVDFRGAANSKVMTTQAPSPAPRYVSVRDYLRVLRRYWIMIVLLAVIGAAAGLIVALRQTPTYTSTAQIGFQDPTQQLSIVGLGSAFVQSPGQLAEINAQTATSPAIMLAVRHTLRTPAPVDALIGAVSAQVSSTSGLLEISANATSPAFATALASTVAKVLIDRDNAQARAEFLRLATNIKSRIAKLTSGRGASAANGQLAFYEDELARLETVAAYATTAQLVTPAQTPSGASSDRTRSALLGLALGLLLGLLAAFVRDSTDRRLRTLQDVRSAFKVPLLGHVRNETMGRIIQLSDGTHQGDARDLEAFRILRRNLEFLDHQNPPRSVVVTSAISEEGKSTVASSLACAMSAAGKRTLLLDCDLRRPSLAKRLGVEQAPGLAEYLAGTASPEETLRTISFADLSAGKDGEPLNNGHLASGAAHELVFIPSGAPTPAAAELLGSPRLQELIDQVIQVYDAVVLDSSPLLPVSDTLEILPHVDAIVLCARDLRTTRDQAAAVKSVLGRFPERPTGLVVTGIKRRDEVDFYAYEYAYDYS